MHLDACVQLAREGDPAAITELIAEFRPRIFRYCMARLGDNGLAEDMTQEVCMALVSALPTYEDRGLPFSAFVFGIASNKVNSARRTLARRSEVTTADMPESYASALGPADLAVSGDSFRGLLAHLNSLPERQRDVLMLRVLGELSADEVAAALGTTAGNVRVLQHRALTALRGRVTPPGREA